VSRRTFFWGFFWILIGLLFVFHVAGGWYFSSEVIDDGFTPNPDPFLVPSGDYQVEEVQYDSELGPMDALYLPAAGSTWVIHVHGKGATPAEAAPLFGPLQQAGYPQLSITYRNDDGQPMDPSGYYQYGVTEWEDVSGAVDYALANGAEQIILSGFSTGAAHIMSFLSHRALDSVDGVLMDSPNLDMAAAVDLAASQRELPLLPITVPATLTEVAKFFTSMRIGVNWNTIDYVSDADVTIRQPVLVHHGTDDMTVPIEVSIAFEEQKPDLIDLIEVQGADHVESYTVEPEQYTESVLGFLAQVG